MKVIAFGASTSSKSINKRLAGYAASLIDGGDVEVLDLNDFALPLYSQDVEEAEGIPAAASSFFEKLGSADALVISFAEHNGSYTAAYKNLFDWCSRINTEVFQDKSAVFLSTSPGKGGAGSVLASAIGSAGFFKADVKASLSVPSFFDNFDAEAGAMKNEELLGQLKGAVAKLA